MGGATCRERYTNSSETWSRPVFLIAEVLEVIGLSCIRTKPVTLSGKFGADAKRYQERAVKAAIEESQI